ncbi:hypothetical protein PYW08_010302 [Mythimna loreyi]|uniref:Uncharacterized protein n=1 Tax=Mythimna loreyi TaxID=667449 RepID=A0ACC2Q621_9NEOP|nr:hypothetical protein PYW08_010302 [Mythimna loreyi]
MNLNLYKMYKMQIVLELFVLLFGISHYYGVNSADIVVTRKNILEYHSDSTYGVYPINGFPKALVYNEVHDSLLYVDEKYNETGIYSFKHGLQTFHGKLERNIKDIYGLAFDPVTELLFFTDTNERSIYWIPIQPGNKTDDVRSENLVIKLDDGIPTDIAVDSCRGYVYWINTNLPKPKIDRVRFDGSERETIIYLNSLYTDMYYKLEPHSLVIDQGAQKMYWIEPKARSKYTIYNADLNGENKKNVTDINFIHYFTNPSFNTMTVSKTHLFVITWCLYCERTIYKLGKGTFPTKNIFTKLSVTNESTSIATEYQIKFQDIKHCEVLTCLEGQNSEPYCVHGEKVLGQCLCKCAPGYFGKRCDVSVCENYNNQSNFCYNGYCSINDDGIPKCRCYSGYSGERCGVSDELYCVYGEKAIGQSFCKCAPGYIGERCDVSVCNNYCLQGHCIVNDEGLPMCRCYSGYSGERCQNYDGLYCVHGEKVIGQSVCKCTPGYIGERCDVSMCNNYCLQGHCIINDEGFPNCRCYSGYSGERCSNYDGLNCVHGEKVIGQSVCKCAPGYIGERCDVSVCDNYCLQGHCTVDEEGNPTCRCHGDYYGERCEKCNGWYCDRDPNQIDLTGMAQNNMVLEGYSPDSKQ